jgi:hypothetical protein
MAFVNLPPNLQDMFYSITDRIAKLETGPNQAMYTAESAQGSAQSASAQATSAQAAAASASAQAAAAGAQATAASVQAGIAQAQATTALANAATAYNAAIGSLQPSASTIVNSTNQMLAIATNGITVYSGSSSSSGARVVMNSAGLAGYNSGGSATFSISASTGAAVFSGSVTGSTITGGTLNIAGNAIIDSSGLLTATGATITGTINATAGYFGTSSNGFSINSTGMIGVGSGVISGGIITTSTGSNAVVLDGPNNALGIKYAGTYAGWLLGIGSGAFMMHYGTSPDIVSGYPRVSVSSSTSSLAANGSNSISITTSGNNMQGAMTFGSTVTANGNVNLGTTTTSVYSDAIRSFTTLSAANVFINSSSGIMARSTASSQRYKHDIVNLTDVPELNPKALYDLPVRAFRFNENYLTSTDDRAEILVPGFIAEEMDAIYPAAVDYNDGQVETWNDRMLVPALLALIQDQDARLKILEGK